MRTNIFQSFFACSQQYSDSSLGTSFSAEEEIEGSYTIEIAPEQNQSTGETVDWNTDNLKVVVIVWKGSGLDAQNGVVAEVH